MATHTGRPFLVDEHANWPRGQPFHETFAVHSLMVAAQFSWSGQRTPIPVGQIVLIFRSLAQAVTLQPLSHVYVPLGHVAIGAAKMGRSISHEVAVAHFGSALFDVHMTLPRARQFFTSDMTFSFAAV